MRRPLTGLPEYAKADFFGPGKHGYTGGMPGVEAATVLSADQFNNMVGELCNAIEGFGGVALDGTQYDQLSQVLTAKHAQLAAAYAAADTSLRAAVDYNQALSGWIASQSEAFHDSGVSVVAGFAANPLRPTINDYIYYAACSNGKIFASRDTTAWSSASAGSSFTSAFYGVTYSHGNMVAYGAGGEIQTCVCGANTWTRQKTGNGAITGLVNNRANTKVIAIDVDGHVWRVNSTPNGTWTDVGALVTTACTDLVAGATTGGADCLVSCGGAGVAVSTDDGSTWTTHTVASGATLYRLTYVPSLGLFVAVGDTSGGVSTIWTSPDAVTWTSVYSDPDGNAAYCVFVTPIPGGVVVSGASDNAPVLAYDGTTVTQLSFLSRAPGSGLNGRAPLAYVFSPYRGALFLRGGMLNGSDTAAYKSAMFWPLRGESL